MPTALSYNRIRLNYDGPWNLGSKSDEVCSNMFVLSGVAPLTTLADAEATALDLHEPIRQLSRTGVSLIGWSYYRPGEHPSFFSKTYALGVKLCNGSAYSSPNTGIQQAEVCVLCVGPTDKNSRGKQVYLRKWIHWVQAGATGNEHAPLAGGDPLLKWKTGAGPNLLVPVDSDSGTQASTWNIQNHLYTHQFRKGKKRKVATKVIETPIPLP